MADNNGTLYTVSREDWSLHRKGHQDQARHQQKVREAIRQNLPDLVSEENIILSDGKQIIKMPIRSLDEYRFVYNYNKNKHVGQGDGDSQVGDVLGVDPAGSKAAREKAPAISPAKMSSKRRSRIAELETMLFEELELPYLEAEGQEQIEIEGNPVHRYPQERHHVQHRQEADDSRKSAPQRARAASRASTASRRTICASRRGRKSSSRNQCRHPRDDGHIGIDGQLREILARAASSSG